MLTPQVAIHNLADKVVSAQKIMVRVVYAQRRYLEIAGTKKKKKTELSYDCCVGDDPMITTRPVVS